jgi:hypothetical protein
MRSARSIVAVAAALLAGCGSSEPAPAQPAGEPAQPRRTASKDQPPEELAGVQAPGLVLVAPDARVGWAVEQATEAGGSKVVRRWAVVGETADSLHVEVRGHGCHAYVPGLEEMVLGLTMRRADGSVQHAVVGRPGTKGWEVRVGEATRPKVEEARGPTVQLAIGVFDAERVQDGRAVRWVGTVGSTKGLLLRYEGERTYELVEMPREEVLDIGGVAVTSRFAAYTNGQREWRTEDPVVAGVVGAIDDDGVRRAILRQETPFAVITTTKVQTDATAELRW